MNYDTDKHGLIGKIGNRGNQFVTTVKISLNIYFNKLINFSEPFPITILRNKTRFYLQNITRKT